MAITILKWNKGGGRIVRLVKYSKVVSFSTDNDWLLLEFDIHLPEHKRVNRKWVPLSTRFEWMRVFN